MKHAHFFFLCLGVIHRQAHFRGHKARSELRIAARERKASVVIQSGVRQRLSYLERRRRADARAQEQEEAESREMAASLIQVRTTAALFVLAALGVSVTEPSLTRCVCLLPQAAARGHKGRKVGRAERRAARVAAKELTALQRQEASERRNQQRIEELARARKALSAAQLAEADNVRALEQARAARKIQAHARGRRERQKAGPRLEAARALLRAQQEAEARELAAVRIQASVRSKMSRSQKSEPLKQRKEAAELLQAMIRGNQVL